MVSHFQLGFFDVPDKILNGSLTKINLALTIKLHCLKFGLTLWNSYGDIFSPNLNLVFPIPQDLLSTFSNSNV